MLEQDKEEKLKVLEAQLLEQEHRPWRLIWNFFRRKINYPDPNDPRRKAVGKAIIWRFLASPATVAVGGSVGIAILSAYLLHQQNNKFDKQNDLLKKQNSYIQLQSNLIEASRKSGNMYLMGELLSDISQIEEDTLPKMIRGRVIGLSSSM